MGSSGSGNFSDYSGRPNQPSGNGGSSGGASGEDVCQKAFSANLEDVGQYDYFSQTGNVPSSGTQLFLELKGRIIAVDSSGRSVGALPTRLNYLASCLKEGVQYTGIVSSSSATPSPRVSADFTPT